MRDATNVQDILDGIAAQNIDRHTPGATESITGYTEAIVEEGTFFPDEQRFTMQISLSLGERLAGRKEQDVSPVFSAGVIVGAALERDVPMDSDEEAAWREGEFVLPDN